MTQCKNEVLVSIIVAIFFVSSVRSPCAWYGSPTDHVQCADLGNLTSFPKWIITNSSITDLQITGKTTILAIQALAFNSSALRTIILSNLGIVSIDSSSFQRLSNLTAVHLKGNVPELKFVLS
jgi:hypothetical protein